MGTQQLTSTFSLGERFHESDLCPDEILTILRTLDDNSNSSVFNVATADILPLKKDKNRTSKENQKRKRPTKSTTSSSLGLCSDEESDEGRALLLKRKIIKRQKGSISLETCMEDGSGKEVGGVGRINNNAKVVSHIAVERNRRKLMNEHLAVLRQLMPSFHVKKGDQASIIGGVINYINELHHVLRSLEEKKRRNMYTSDMCPSPGVASSPRFSAPRKHLDTSPLSPRKQHFSPRPVTNFPVTPRTPQSTSSYYKTPSYIHSLTLNTTSFSSSIANRNLMMNIYNHNNSGVDNELVTSIKSDFADVDVKFCGANLQLQTISSKMAGQSVKIASAIEDLSLEILQLSINTIEETMLNAFTIKIGIDCQLSAEELAQKIQNTFC